MLVSYLGTNGKTLLKVKKVRDTHKDPILPSSHHKKTFDGERSRYLYLGKNSKGQLREVYAHRTTYIGPVTRMKMMVKVIGTAIKFLGTP